MISVSREGWQTYVNEDGSFKYDPVIYSNQNYPWMNAEGKNYSQYKVGTGPGRVQSGGDLPQDIYS